MAVVNAVHQPSPVVNAVHQHYPSRRRPSCRHCPSIARATALAATVLAAALAAAALAAAVHCAPAGSAALRVPPATPTALATSSRVPQYLPLEYQCGRMGRGAHLYLNILNT